MVLTQGERMLVTPTGHVYAMYAPHQGGTSVRTLIETDTEGFGGSEGEGSVPVVSGSASLKDKTLFLTLTNSHAVNEQAVAINLIGGASARSGTAHVLSGEIHAHNTYDQPATVAPRPFELDASGTLFTLALPPASVITAMVALA